MTRRWRSTIRVRLTLLYGGAFFLAGAILVVLLHLYLGQSLRDHLSARRVFPDHQILPEVVQQLRSGFDHGQRDTLHAMGIASLVSLGVLGVAAGGFGWLLAGRALRPLRHITATACRVADRSLHERIALDGPDDEIKDLADTFDAMLERLDRAFDSQRRFVANASHELRTPLTINRTLIEVALDAPHTGEPLRQLATNLLAVNRRHERLIDGLLTLANSEEQLSTRTPLDLADVVRYVIAESQTAARQAGVQIRTALAPAPVAGDPVLLERLTQNLIDNAIRHNITEHGWIAVSTETLQGCAMLTVENTGSPVPNYEIPGLFEPFRRLASTDRRATPSGDHGAGLGLSIVRSIVHAHSGEVHATARPDGGLTARVRIPN